jgi:hypothetical protein
VVFVGDDDTRAAQARVAGHAVRVQRGHAVGAVGGRQRCNALHTLLAAVVAAGQRQCRTRAEAGHGACVVGGLLAHAGHHAGAVGRCRGKAPVAAQVGTCADAGLQAAHIAGQVAVHQRHAGLAQFVVAGFKVAVHGTGPCGACVEKARDHTERAAARAPRYPRAGEVDAPMTTQDDLAHWLSRTALQDRAAFEQLYRATSAGTCWAWRMGVLQRRDWAEDVLQEAFMNVWYGAAGYNRALASP